MNLTATLPRTAFLQMERVARFRPTPKQVFAIVSLALIMVIGVTTSVSQGVFFRRAIIERESRIIDDIVDAVAGDNEAFTPVMDRYWDPEVRNELAHRFGLLRKLPGVQRVKVFNREGTIAWSDKPSLIGTKKTRHPEELQAALGGNARAVNSRIEGIEYVGAKSHEPLIEFYVPFSWTGPVSPGNPADGVVAIYRSPKELNLTILSGRQLLWLVTAIGGGILFIAIFALYRAVYNRHREVEWALAQFTQEHERIIQIEKLSAVGQMVTEIAHQLNNPLVGVINLAALAEREAGNSDRLRELLQGVQSAGHHCRDFVQRMLRLNAAARSEPKPTDIVEVVDETATLFKQSSGKHPEIVLDLPAQPLVLEIDPVLIRHALFNLLNNAAQADPAGRVTVSVALAARDGYAGCTVTVTDCGEGIDPKIAAKLFTPFFTTRPGGTGLGLLVAQQIVIKHRGSLRAESVPGGGARFAIWLPLQLRSLRENRKPPLLYR
ncbi:MAG: sensor histidine kinase [Ramlibacter sp.]